MDPENAPILIRTEYLASMTAGNRFIRGFATVFRPMNTKSGRFGWAGTVQVNTRGWTAGIAITGGRVTPIWYRF